MVIISSYFFCYFSKIIGICDFDILCDFLIWHSPRAYQKTVKSTISQSQKQQDVGDLSVGAEVSPLPGAAGKGD
jgi:hypothetical protein